jgi:hypothetical protein
MASASGACAQVRILLGAPIGSSANLALTCENAGGPKDILGHVVPPDAGSGVLIASGSSILCACRRSNSTSAGAFPVRSGLGEPAFVVGLHRFRLGTLAAEDDREGRGFGLR